RVALPDDVVSSLVGRLGRRLVDDLDRPLTHPVLRLCGECCQRGDERGRHGGEAQRRARHLAHGLLHLALRLTLVARAIASAIAISGIAAIITGMLRRQGADSMIRLIGCMLSAANAPTGGA